MAEVKIFAPVDDSEVKVIESVTEKIDIALGLGES